MKIAVIGSGISGLSSAYYLSKKHKVDLFEKQDRFGGHSYTLDVKFNDNEKVAVDIGFMVFKKITYPNLINFFKENEIEIEEYKTSQVKSGFGRDPDLHSTKRRFTRY